MNRRLFILFFIFIINVLGFSQSVIQVHLATYEKHIKSREFRQALEIIKFLRKQQPQDKRIEKLYNQTVILNKFWLLVEEGVKHSIGKLLVVQYNNNFVGGELIFYRNGDLELKNKNAQKIIRIPLKKLRAHYITPFVLTNKENLEITYMGILYFCYVNNDPWGAQEAIWELNSQNIEEEILSWATKPRVHAGEIIKCYKVYTKPEGTRIAHRIFKNYKKASHTSIFNDLLELKNTVSRIELMEINGELEKEQGKSLSTIVKKIYSDCSICKNQRLVVCNRCNGSGKFQTTKKHKVKVKINCKTCKGKGKYACLYCYNTEEKYYDEVARFYIGLPTQKEFVAQVNKIITRIIANYNSKEHIKIFEDLIKLKDLVPRNELIKMNKRFRKKQGYCLITIATITFDRYDSGLAKNPTGKENRRKYQLVVGWYKGF